MAHSNLTDHPDRYALTNELHARPFPEITAPCRAIHLAIISDEGAERDPEVDRAHLFSLLDRYGAQHPAPNANHYSGSLGRAHLKWERHTEFVTYTLFVEGVSDTPFDGSSMALFPADWLAETPGYILTAALVRVELADSMNAAEQALKTRLRSYFAPESLAASRVVDDSALIISDFRIHEAGQARAAVLVKPDVGPRRIGRIVQRVLEIETYKSAALLTLPVARDVAKRVNEEDRKLSQLVREMAANPEQDSNTLVGLLEMSAKLEALSSQSAFRFGARGAYDAIVKQRIEVLREERAGGLQTYAEFMMRRFEPAMRTCESAERRLTELALRTERAATLLRTRVDVQLERQNQRLLESMDQRAGLQLRLQQTVEGLSVVAISYYAVSLMGYLLAPVGTSLGLDKSAVVAGVTVPVVAVVWMFVRRLRRGIETKGD